MRLHSSVVTATVIVLSMAPQARADVISFATGNFSVTNPNFVGLGTFAVPAGTAYGVSFAGDWTDGGGFAFSNELQIRLTDPSAAVSAPFAVGGRGNGSPFTFPGPPTFTNAGLAYPAGQASGGNWTIEAGTEFGASTAIVANSSVTFYYSTPTSPSLNYSGTTAGGPTFLRPNQGGTTTTTTGRPFSVQPFLVDTTGDYLLGTQSAGDGYLLLYQNNFDPLSPLTNLIGISDDGAGGTAGTSEFFTQLTTGVSYFLVNSTFSSTAGFGFSSVVVGVGGAAVPEPTSMILAGIGAVGFGWKKWRRRTA